MYKIKEAEFILGIEDISQAPTWGWPEVAVVGRSNVGKSSFINRLTARRALARSSSTPGRTKEINFFRVALLDGHRQEQNLILVDLPGYGFAKASKKERNRLHALIAQYIDMRESLGTICLLNDIRRIPEVEEIEIRNIAYNLGRQVLIVMTKADKLKASALKKQADEVAYAYGLESSDAVLTGSGMDPAPIWSRIISGITG